MFGCHCHITQFPRVDIIRCGIIDLFTMILLVLDIILCSMRQVALSVIFALQPKKIKNTFKMPQ